MKHATLLPVDSNGNPLPVFPADTKKTQVLTCTDAGVEYASAVFSVAARTKAFITTGADDSAITFTAVKDGDPRVRVEMTEGTALAVSVSGRDITITWDNSPASTAADVVAKINADPIASCLVVASFGGDGSGTTLVAIATLTYLEGWDEGNCAQIVRVWAEEDCFIGLFPESGNEDLTCGMPVTAKSETWVAIGAEEKIAAKCATAGAKVYLTPGRTS